MWRHLLIRLYYIFAKIKNAINEYQRVRRRKDQIRWIDDTPQVDTISYDILKYI